MKTFIAIFFSVFITKSFGQTNLDCRKYIINDSLFNLNKGTLREFHVLNRYTKITDSCLTVVVSYGGCGTPAKSVLATDGHQYKDNNGNQFLHFKLILWAGPCDAKNVETLKFDMHKLATNYIKIDEVEKLLKVK